MCRTYLEEQMHSVALLLVVVRVDAEELLGVPIGYSPQYGRQLALGSACIAMRSRAVGEHVPSVERLVLLLHVVYNASAQLQEERRERHRGHNARSRARKRTPVTEGHEPRDERVGALDREQHVVHFQEVGLPEKTHFGRRSTTICCIIPHVATCNTTPQ